jgi:hypothetical protein
MPLKSGTTPAMNNGSLDKYNLKIIYGLEKEIKQRLSSQELNRKAIACTSVFVKG